MDSIIERNRLRRLPNWRRIRRIQIEVVILAVVLAMAAEAIKLGATRNALITHHDEAARNLEWLARELMESYAEIPSNSPIPPPDLLNKPTAKNLKRGQAYRRLARWYRWQAWRYRLPLFTSVSKYKNLTEVEIDTREFIEHLGRMERIERELNADEEVPSR